MNSQQGILQEVLRPQPVPNWLLIWSLTLVLGFIITRLLYPKYWGRFRQSLAFSMEAERLLKEKNINLLQFGFILNTLSSLSIALFLFVALSIVGVRWPNNSLKDLILFSVLFLALSVFRFLAVDLLGKLLKNSSLGARINHMNLLHLKFFGFYMIFGALMLSFFPDPIQIIPLIGGSIIILIMMIMNYLRAFELLLQERISILYGILYLCTLEFAPILVIVNVVIV